MSKTPKTVATVETAQVETKTYDMNQINEQFGGVKSKMIRYLASEGIKTAEITKMMKTVYPDFIYQHARNVLNQKVKTND
jgi:hypothetical protein